MRITRQRDALLEKGSAMMLQGAWRKKQARRKAAAMKAAKEEKLRQGAALRLQGAYRIRRARKKAAVMKAKAEEVRMQGASLMLQGAWRRKQARKHVAELKAEKQRILEKGSAILVQSAWRAKQAKRLVGEARAELAKSNAMSNVLQGRMRQHLAKNKTKHAFRKWTRPFLIKVVGARGLKQADAIGSSDPFVFVTALEPEAPEDHTQATKLTQSAAELAITDELGEQKMRYTSACIKNSLNPDWNEEVLITGTNGFCNLVFTVLDKDMMQIGDYDFLGQCVKSMAHEDVWHSGAPFQVELPLGDYKHPVINDKGKPVGIEEGTGQGSIIIEFIPQNSHGVIAGYGERFCQNKGFSLGNSKSGWERKWIALTHREGLKCWDNLNNMNDCDKHVAPIDVTGVQILTNHEGKDTVLEITRRNDPKPILLTIEGQGKVLQWKSKLEHMIKVAAEELYKNGGAEEPSEKRSTSTGFGGSPFKGFGGFGKKG
mmetsp:Transcript_71370/g.201306  ORF Transcript_71370/g.201306 Transcript_71370/m.201306 type:complete len:487 (+) Transcript_71370:1459-2919(+)